jgi:uncharacterized SAM-binding protein YcdF (DUF218 family)
MSIESNNLNRGWLKPAFFVAVVTVCLPMVATAAISGKSSVEKMLTNMVQPLFIAIVAALTIGIVLFRRGERGIGGLLFLGAATIWILGSQAFTSILINKWEQTISSTELSVGEPIDYLVVLGGGSSVAPDGRAQFNLAGDRVGYAARLFLAGKAKNLITTGDNLILTGTIAGKFRQLDDPSEQTKQIWMDLGIPSEVIHELSGENTSSEMASLRSHPEYWQDKRCAILTSALHLPRAMQLAQRAGIIAVPIAADYRSGRGPMTINQFVPEAEELSKLHQLLKEWIGMQVGR